MTDWDAVFGMARMYQLSRDKAPYEIEVFRQLDDAIDWALGASPAELG